MLGPQITRGQRLIGMTSMLGQLSDFEFWHAKRRGWTSDTLTAVAANFGESAANAFERAVTVAHSERPWFEDLPREVQGVRGGVAVLRSLESERVHARQVFPGYAREYLTVHRH
jgi:hypothetical protein